MAFVLSYIFAVVTFIWLFITTLQLASSLSDTTVSASAVKAWALASGQNETSQPPNPTYLSDWGRVLWNYLWNLSLVIVFVFQHSFMASPEWKEILQDLGLRVQTRSIYAFMTTASLQILMYHWVFIPAAPLWWIDVTHRPLLWLFFVLLHSFMWVLIFGAALTMDLPELVGIKQVYYADQGYDTPMAYKSREVRSLYRHMRHAGVWCFLVILWVHPVMTLDRWLLAVAWTIYLLWGFRVTQQDYEYVEKQYYHKHSQQRSVHVYEEHTD